MAMKFNRNFDIGRVVKRLVYVILALYVGGTIISVFGDVMNCTTSPFYDGVSLIGWTLTDYASGGAGDVCSALSNTTPYTNVITSVSGSGVLAVVGIIGIAGVVMEFVR